MNRSKSSIAASIRNRNRAGKYHWSNEARERHMNANNPMWKGNDVGYCSLHQWIVRHKPKPTLCEHCHQKPPIDVANISGNYLRDINDYQWICRGCHMLSDGRIKNLKQFKEGDNN